MVFAISRETKKNIEVKGKRVGDYFFDEKTNTLFYSLPYPFPCKFAMTGLEKIISTPAIEKLPHFLTYHTIDWLEQQLLQIQLVNSGYLLLHAASWFKAPYGYMAVGFANSGKTTSVLQQVKDGASFGADENVIVTIKKGMVWSYPVSRHTSLNPYLAKEINYPLTIKQKLQFVGAKLKSKMMPIFEPNIWVDLPYVRHSFAVQRLIYLTEGKGKSLKLLTDNEFPFYTNPAIQTYCYASGYDLDGVYKKYTKLIKEVEKCLR